MPVLAGMISGFFGYIVSFLVQRMTVGFAAAAAFMITMGAAFIAVKLALGALAAGIAVVLPPSAFVLLSYCVPANIGACITGILIGDAVVTSYDYWRSTMGVAMQLAKG